MLSESVIEWGDLSLHGTPGAGRLTFRTLDGWEGFDGEVEDYDRPGAHGAFDSPVYVRARRVLVTGRAGSRQERDAVLARIGASMTPGVADLRITHAGRALTTRARLLRYSPTPPPQAWGAGFFEWAAEWRCADPLRYADAVSLDTGFATPGGGLAFPLFTDGTTDVGYLDFGAPGSTGRVTLPVQPGTAPGQTQFVVEGPTPPFSIVHVESGRRIRFAQAVAAGASLVIDPAAGSALLNGGDVDYSGLLTRWEWEPVRNGESATFAFLPDGPVAAGSLTVTHRAAWW